MCNCNELSDQELEKEEEMSDNCKNCLAIAGGIVLFILLTFTAYFSYQKGVEQGSSLSINVQYK